MCLHVAVPMRVSHRRIYMQLYFRFTLFGLPSGRCLIRSVIDSWMNCCLSFSCCIDFEFLRVRVMVLLLSTVRLQLMCHTLDPSNLHPDCKCALNFKKRGKLTNLIMSFRAIGFGKRKFHENLAIVRQILVKFWRSIQLGRKSNTATVI
jgi:hypothetical protein